MTRLDIWRRYSEYNPHMDTRAANLKPNTGTVYLFTNCHLKLSSFNSVARADYQYSICMLRQARQGRAKETPRIELPVFSAQPTSRNRGRPILSLSLSYLIEVTQRTDRQQIPAPSPQFTAGYCELEHQ